MEESKCSKCSKCFQEVVIPELDFLHSPPSYKTKKITSWSRLGLSLTFLMFVTFIVLFIIFFIKAKNDYTVSYSQDFILRKDFSKKKITLGFNTSSEWKNKLIFELYDSENKIIDYKNCDENLTETQNNWTYHCIVNYSIVKAPLISYALKLHITLKNRTEEEYDVPFSFVIREPYIDHDNIENPLNFNHKNSTNKFSCIYNTKEISSYRRYLKLINYITDGGLRNEDSIIDGIYLDDIEDSLKIKNDKEIGSFLGSYRILLSKKIDIYERKYISFYDFFSKFGGFLTLVYSIFKFIAKIIVSPNDKYRIYQSLKKNNSSFVESQKIHDKFYKKEKDALSVKDFEDKVKNDSWCNKLRFLCCFCCYYCERTKHIYMADDYINDYLTIENQIEKENEENKNNGKIIKQINSNNQIYPIELGNKNENINNNYNYNYRHTYSYQDIKGDIYSNIFEE